MAVAKCRHTWLFFIITAYTLSVIFLYVLLFHIAPQNNMLQRSENQASQPSQTTNANVFEVYLRYTSTIKQFPVQAERWILRSMSLFWPKHSKIVVVLDEESKQDQQYGRTLTENTTHNALDLRVCYMKPYPQELIHHWGKMRMYMDMLHADLCTNATYVGFVDVDTLFTTAVTPSLILADMWKPVVIARIGDPRIPCWLQSAAHILKQKQVMQCMHYFPVTFKTAHITELRHHVAALHGKNFSQVISETTGKLNLHLSCYCHYSIMCNYVWFHHRYEYDWHLQYVKPQRPSEASVPDKYFFTEVLPEEKIPQPRSSIHIRHFMLNGKYMDAVEPTARFVNDSLIEGLCYSFGIPLCGELCKKYNKSNIHVNLFNFENYDWLWDARCKAKQIEHYTNVENLFTKNFFYMNSKEKLCNAIADLQS